MMRFETKEKALEYCFENMKQSIIGKENYNKYKQYMYRHNKGDALKDTAINTLFELFDIKQHCYYTKEEGQSKK